MTSESDGVDVLSPDGLQELVGALKATCVEVAAARLQLESHVKSAVEELRSAASRDLSKLQKTAEERQAGVHLVVSSALGRLAEIERRAAELAASVQGELGHSVQARSRVESALDTTSSTLLQVRADRETWEARGRAERAKQEAIVEELRRALADAASRVTALESENRRLSGVQEALDARLSVLEKKKVFGIF
jgi:hypothetical protein